MKKILIVEDDEDLSRLIRTRLVSAGFDALAVPDALWGVQQLNEYKPDLVILDLLLPAGGGLTVLQRLKTSVYTTHIPVLVISGMGPEGDPEYFKQIENMGVDGFIKKPFDGKQLAVHVRRILGEQVSDDPVKDPV